jgi:hypothetical protein
MASHILWFSCATNYEHRMTHQSPGVTRLEEINGFYSRIAFTQMDLVSPSIITRHARACAQRHNGQKSPSWLHTSIGSSFPINNHASMSHSRTPSHSSPAQKAPQFFGKLPWCATINLQADCRARDTAMPNSCLFHHYWFQVSVQWWSKAIIESFLKNLWVWLCAKGVMSVTHYRTFHMSAGVWRPE